VLLYPLPAVVIALDWTRLARPRGSALQLLLILALALLPALARPRWLRAVLATLGLAAAASTALAVSWRDARPFDARHDFFGPLLSRFGNGFLDFYDYSVPIDPSAHPGMHGVLLLAVFGFCLALGLAIAARRAVAAGLVLVVGAGWPATLLAGGHEVWRGTWILAGLLVLLSGLGSTTPAGLRRAFVPAAAVVLAAVAASASPALAKPEFLRWQTWDFYTRPDVPVGVRYVWDSTYTGIRFPKKVTTVLTIKAPPTSLYWRATTLEGFNGIGWVERQEPQAAASAVSALEPQAATNRRKWIPQEVTVKALRDVHLVAASIPVAFDAGGAAVSYGRGNVALVPSGLTRDQRYRAWSYGPTPNPNELARSRPRYPAALAEQGLLAVPGVEAVPSFGEPGRRERLRSLMDAASAQYIFDAYRPLEAKAQEIAGDAQSPYAAVASLETWFRSTGGFEYDQQPPEAVGAPPLVDFVTRTKAGYCQHFAGAMAMMLRYLGIPARVAAGFTSGTYSHKGEWTVTDHDAHTWVEVWFDGYGWLPFDPTPGRGSLSATYSVSSPRFDLGTIAKYLGAAVTGGEDAADIKQNGSFGQRGVDRGSLSRADPPGDTSLGVPGRGAGGSLLKLLAFVALVLGAAIVLLKTLRRASRYLTRDPRRIAGACRSELADYLLDQGVRLSEGATLEDVGAAARSELSVDSTPFVRAAAAARYGPPAHAARAAARARRELRRLRRDMRRRLGTLDRVRGLVSLRSLGFFAG
jgi:transglutaminase-like putative cysteine protease